MIQDLRYACRSLVKTPGFTIVAVLTLALGIGANAAIFQLIDAVALRPLPIAKPHELVEVRIAGGNPGFGITEGPYAELTRPVWNLLKEHQQALDGLFAWSHGGVAVGERSNFHFANSLSVSGDFFRTLGVVPHRGRLIGPADEATSCPSRIAVVSYDYWQREMGARELAPNPLLQLNFESVEIVGVAAPGFKGVVVGDAFDFAFPLCQQKEERREVFDIAVMGRLRSGWTIERASVHFDAISAGIFEAAAPSGYGPKSTARFKAFRLSAVDASRGVSALRAEYTTSLRLLFAITVIVLLIACANLANLLLARASARDRELAVRVAIGASRSALVRPVLAESALLAVAGSLMAIALAQILGRYLLAAIATGGRGPDLSLDADWQMLAFAAIAGFVTCVVFGTAPAIRSARIAPLAAMRSGGKGLTTGHDRLSVQRVMVGAQVAMAVIMLVAALLFVISFRKLTTVDTGMRHAGVSIVNVRFPESVGQDRFDDYRRELLRDIQALPGVMNAGTTSNTPLVGGSWTHGVRVGAVENNAQFTWVSPGYFPTMGIGIVQGRDFSLRDTRSSPRVAIVNHTFVRRFIPSGSPLGQRLRTSPEPRYPATEYEIVGVIPDTHYNSLRGERRAMVFAPDTQHPSPGPGGTVMVHSRIAPQEAIESVRRLFVERHPMTIVGFANLETRIQDRLVRERLLATLAAFFGVLAVLLTMVGLYGMLSYAVSRRRQELGVRVALGARGRHVLGLVMGETGRLVAIGTALGIVASLAAARSVGSLLFGVHATDPWVLTAACALLAAVAAIASYLPARRAMKVNPIVALRCE
jgi:predicted permease